MSKVFHVDVCVKLLNMGSRGIAQNIFQQKSKHLALKLDLDGIKIIRLPQGWVQKQMAGWAVILLVKDLIPLSK